MIEMIPMYGSLKILAIFLILTINLQVEHISSCEENFILATSLAGFIREHWFCPIMVPDRWHVPELLTSNNPHGDSDKLVCVLAYHGSFISLINFFPPYSWTVMYGTSGFIICVILIFITSSLDTVYGCQDRKDDIKIGIWSTALLFGEHVKTAAAICDVAFIIFLYLAGKANGHGLPFYVICVGGSIVQFIYQLLILDINSTQSCWGAQFYSCRKHTMKSYAIFLIPLQKTSRTTRFTLVR